ncbi:hypothetical protein BU15DRAFT_82167 [Melanogaster broomeanus]|nr:hypothetical protein BU15DRAFT_82167 [Melanogaster broomeanus]
MPAWTLVNSSPTKGRTFKRPLDAKETGFFWDGVFNGTADSVQHLRLHLLNEADAYIFSESNITRTWLSVKRRYPLVGARVDMDNEEPHFIVEEHHLGRSNPNEVVFGRVMATWASGRKAFPKVMLFKRQFIMIAVVWSVETDVTRTRERAGTREVEWVKRQGRAPWSIQNFEDVPLRFFCGGDTAGPRTLSNHLLARIFIFRETDRADVIHMFTVIAHCITDGTVYNSFLRCFLDALSSRSEPPISGLEQRLAMVIASADLEPKHSFSLARRRWRRAIGFVIFGIRAAKRQGGHTLPCRLTHSTSRVPARARVLVTSISRDQTAAILMNCRLNNITFGNAFLPLAQVAMTRVLYRRYLRGEIDEEEWEYRKKQPHINRGPLNLRPYLDQQWFSKGGGGEFFLAISYFFYQLPFMTLGVTTQQHRDDLALSNGAPPQLASSTTPLFLEIASVEPITQLERTRVRALEWLKSVEEGTTADDTEVLAPADFPGTTWAHGGSSIGNLDEVSAVEYPLRSTNPLSPRSNIPHPAKAGYIIPSLPDITEDEPRIAVEYWMIHLHARPGQLYLGAATIRKQLHMQVSYDVNVSRKLSPRNG